MRFLRLFLILAIFSKRPFFKFFLMNSDEVFLKFFLNNTFLSYQGQMRIDALVFSQRYQNKKVYFFSDIFLRSIRATYDYKIFFLRILGLFFFLNTNFLKNKTLGRNLHFLIYSNRQNYGLKKSKKKNTRNLDFF